MDLNDDPALTCLLKFDGDTLDSSLLGANPGSLVGEPSDGSAYIPGVFGQGVHRNASAYVNVPHDDSVSDIVFSFAYWAKHDVFVNASSVVRKVDGGTSRNFAIYHHLTGKVEYTTKGAITITANSNSNMVLNEWTHIGMTCTGTEFIGYFNGVQDTNIMDCTGNVILNTDSIRVANINPGETGVDVDDFRYYKGKVLTPAEMLILATNPYMLPPTSFAATPV